MKHTELVLRQLRLQRRSAELRRKLTTQTQALQQPLALADRLRTALQWLYRRPLVPLAGLALLLALRPQRILLWGGRMWWGWSVFKKIQHWHAKLPPQNQPS